MSATKTKPDVREPTAENDASTAARSKTPRRKHKGTKLLTAILRALAAGDDPLVSEYAKYAIAHGEGSGLGEFDLAPRPFRPRKSR